MAKARYKDEDVVLLRGANAGDPGYDAKIKAPVLVKTADGKKLVVPGGQVLLYAADD